MGKQEERGLREPWETVGTMGGTKASITLSPMDRFSGLGGSLGEATEESSFVYNANLCEDCGFGSRGTPISHGDGESWTSDGISGDEGLVPRVAEPVVVGFSFNFPNLHSVNDGQRTRGVCVFDRSKEAARFFGNVVASFAGERIRVRRALDEHGSILVFCGGIDELDFERRLVDAVVAVHRRDLVVCVGLVASRRQIRIEQRVQSKRLFSAGDVRGSGRGQLDMIAVDKCPDFVRAEHRGRIEQSIELDCRARS